MVNKLVHLNPTTFPSSSQQDESCFGDESTILKENFVKGQKTFDHVDDVHEAKYNSKAKAITQTFGPSLNILYASPSLFF